MKKALFTILVTAILLTALSIYTSADNFIITDFDSAPACKLDFLPGNAVSGLDIANDLIDFDSHGKILAVQTENTDSSVVRTLNISAADLPLDLSPYKSLGFSVFIEPIEQTNSSCFVRTMLTGTDGETHESISSVDSGIWVDISIDISAFMGRGGISQLEIGIIPDHIDSGIWNGGFAIDSIYASEPVNNTLASRYCFESFNAIGTKAVLSPDNSSLTLEFDNTGESYFEFPIALIPHSFSNTIRINLENDTDAESITLVLLKEENIRPVRIEKQIKSHADPCVYEFEITNPLSVKALRIEFPRTKGSVTIRSIEFTSSYNSTPYITYGSITGCTANSDNSSVSISGELGREYVTEFSGTELCLYSLDLSDDPRKFDYAGTEPLAKHGISTKFRFTVDAAPNEDFRLKKYVVMISTTPMVFVDTPTYVTDMTHPVRNDTFKAGASLDSAFKTAESLSRATVVSIDLDKLISDERNGYMHTSGGKQYYFTADTVDELDRELGAYSASGMSVLLRITKGKLSFPDIKSEQGYDNFRAAMEFLAKRYAVQEHSAVDGIIIGRAVNTGNKNESAVSMTDYVNSYVQLMRLAHLSCASAGSGIPIYASLGDVFEYESLECTSNRFDTEDFLCAVGDYIADEGEFSWGICIESESGRDETNRTLSLDEPDELYELFALISMKESLKNKPITIIDRIDFTCPDDDFAKAVATRAVFAAGTGKISRYIASPEAKSPHISQIGAAIKALNSADRILLEGIGANVKSYDRLTDTKKIKVIKLYDLTVSDKLGFEPVGSYTYLDFNSYDQLDSVILSHNASKIKLVPMQTGTLAMRAELSRDSGDEPLACAILTKTLDVESTPVISLDLIASDISEKTELTLRIVGENSIATAKTELEPDVRKKVYVDLSELEKADKIELSVRGNTDKVTLYADDLIGYSSEYDTKRLFELANKNNGSTDNVRSLNPTVVTVFLLVIIILLSLVIILSVNSRKNEK
ncbi:MAG: hypothetical protein J6V93_00790 [Clostridia bacterium]|nr:hypothetical protein [Clostridia bacterium]